MLNTSRRAWRGAVRITAAVLPCLAACETITGVNEPDELRLRIQSDDVVEVTLITSAHFEMVEDPACPETCDRRAQLTESDTSTVSLPFDRTYPFTSRLQYFVESYPPAGVTATVHMRIDIDGREWYNDARALNRDGAGGAAPSLMFVYNFRERTLD